ncbi:AraC family transcriptional regulator [Pediococcus pentosaceus]|uniref:AraC family transcriptional regulator n=1 Tax=Pediococcus pentosaceus TaxID=1255 RepID=UPI003593F0A4
MNPRVLNMLSQTNILEEQQKKLHKFIEDMPAYAIQNGKAKNKTQTLNNMLFKNRDIYVSRHNRYASYPAHAHTFLEMNYILQGTATETLNGKKIELKKGDLLLLDVGASHSIDTLSENDILINILFKEQVISINLLNDLRRSNSILYDFLIDRSLGVDSTLKNNFLLFKRKPGHEISDVLDKIIEEYYLKRDFSNSIIKSYLQVLLVELVRNYPLNTDDRPTKSQILITKILKQISENYRTICLDELAHRYKYNKNYLANLFKGETGKTFTQMVTQQRLIQAHNLITSSNSPITEIMHKVGINNKTFFYKKYKEFYQCNPGDDR